VERVCILASQFGIGKTLTADLAHSQREAVSVFHVLAIVVTEHLFINIAFKMKRLNSNVGSAKAALKQGPEVLRAIGGWPTFTFFVKVGTARSVATVFLCTHAGEAILDG
jgi:hypothetical protein